MSSCTDIRDELKAYADGELTGSLRGSVRQHVERCTACGRELEEIQSLSRQLRVLDTAVPRPELRSRILAHVPINEIQPSRRPNPWWRMPGFALGLGTAACALLLFVLIAPFASDTDKDLAAVQQRMESDAPVARSAAGASAIPHVESEVPARTNGKDKVVKLADSANKDAFKPKGAPVNSRSIPPAPELKEVSPAPGSLLARRPMAVPGLYDLSDKLKAPVGEITVEKLAAKRGEARGGAALGQLKGETSVAVSAPKPSVPEQSPAGPAGGLGGGSRAPQVAGQDEKAALVKLQTGNAQNQAFNAPQNASQYNYRSEALELTVTDLESAANGILFFAQDEGGKPVLPEKLAEPGAEEMVLTVLIPAEKVDAVRAKLSQYRSLTLGRDRKDEYLLGSAVGRQNSERGIKNQADNRAYFGMAPRDNLSREMFRQRGQASLEEQKGGFADLDAGKVQAQPAAGARTALGYKQSVAKLPSLKKQNEAMVRLVIKLRTPPKPAQAQKKGKE